MIDKRQFKFVALGSQVLASIMMLASRNPEIHIWGVFPLFAAICFSLLLFADEED